MKRLWMTLGVVGAVVWLAAPAMAQDYRARVQGQVTDESRGALPGAPSRCGTRAPASRPIASPMPKGAIGSTSSIPEHYTVTAALQGFRSGAQRERPRPAAR